MSRDQHNPPNESILLENEEQRISICSGESSMLAPSAAAALPMNNSDDLLLNLDNAFGAAVAESAILPNELMSHNNLTFFSDGAVSEDAPQNHTDPDNGNGTTAGRMSLDDYKCPICLDTFINTVKVDCSYGHKFCNYCITSWISIGRHLITECPVCRGPIFGKTLDLKTDAEIRSLFQRMTENDKTARLLSIKERLQIEYPRVNSCLLDFAPSRYLQNSYAEGMNIATGGQYSFQHGYYQQQPYHHYHHHNNAQYNNFQMPPAENDNPSATRDANNNTSDQNRNESMQNLGVGESLIQDLFGPHNPTSGMQETSRLPMWMAPTPPSTDTQAQNHHHHEPPTPTPTIEQNAGDRTEPAEIRYQHYHYQNRESSRWNNNLYIAPEDNSRRSNEASIWAPSERESVTQNNILGSTTGNRQQPLTSELGNEASFPHNILNSSQEVPFQHNNLGGNENNYHEPDQTQTHHDQAQSGASYPHGTDDHSYNIPPQAQNQHFHNPEQWHYQHHHHHFTPVLIACSPVMPSPLHYHSSCGLAHCYFAPCALHNHSASHMAHFVPGMVHSNQNAYSQPETRNNPPATAPRMRPNVPGRNSMPVQLPTPNAQSTPQRTRTYSSLPNSPTAGSPRSNEEDRRRRRHYHRNSANSFGAGGLSPRTYSAGNGIDLNSRNPHRVSSCPVLSHGSHFSGGFSLFSRGYVGFQISHLPAHDRRVVAPPGRITHPLVSLHPLTPDGTSARVTLTFDVHRV